MFCIGQSAPLALKSVRRQQGTPGTLIPDQTKAVPVLISSILLLANIKFYTVRRTFNSLPERTGWENESSSLKALDSQPRMNFLPWQPMAGELRKWTAINIHKFCALFFIKNYFLWFIFIFLLFLTRDSLNQFLLLKDQKFDVVKISESSDPGTFSWPMKTQLKSFLRNSLFFFFYIKSFYII